jgi:hypothetical protein
MTHLKNYFLNNWDSPILYTVTAEMVQDLIEPNLGKHRRKIQRLKECWTCKSE